MGNSKDGMNRTHGQCAHCGFLTYLAKREGHDDPWECDLCRMTPRGDPVLAICRVGNEILAALKEIQAKL